MMDRLIQANIYGDKRIVLSEHNQGKDVVFSNSLEVEVANVSYVETASWINDLAEGAPIPDIDTEQDQVSVIYVYFPIGSGDAYLTTKELAEQMKCYAPYNWGVEQAYDPNGYGVYFKIYPLDGMDLAPREKLYFSIRNVVSFGELEKMVYMAVRFTNISMSGGQTLQSIEEDRVGTDYLALFKKRSPLKIVNLSCNRSKVAVGDRVKLEWAVAGDATKCILTPGDIVVERVGSLEMEVIADTTFRLYAFGSDQQISRTATVFVEAPVISRFISDCPDNKTVYGRPVLLTYEVKDGYGIYLNQGIGRVSNNTISVVPTREKTEYVLSCMGPDKLVQERLTITITDFLKVIMIEFSRSYQADNTYLYHLKWQVANFTTIELKTSDGKVRSSGKGEGDISFPDSSATALTLSLQCTGPSGQVINRSNITV